MQLRTHIFFAVLSLLGALPVFAQAELQPSRDMTIAPPSSAETEQKSDPIGSLIEREARLPKRELPAADLIARANAPDGFREMIFAKGEQDPGILKLQVLLDRAHASPGVIDGYNGDNVAKAVAAVETMFNLPVDGIIDEQLWIALELANPSPPLTDYLIDEKDVVGPYVPDLPKDYAEMAKLERLAYRDAVEMLAEKFHMDEDLLRQLNPDANFSQPGTKIVVADVGGPASLKVVKLVADKERKHLLGYDSTQTLVVSYPATIGSADLPSPDGTHLVKAIATDPEYWYRPKVNFQQGSNVQALKLAPGPNNPVGSAWIGLDKPTYGIHGTPSPSKIDKTNSHGCIRLTNWDVRELSKLVQPGVVVAFVGTPPDPEAVGSISKR